MKIQVMLTSFISFALFTIYINVIQNFVTYFVLPFYILHKSLYSDESNNTILWVSYMSVLLLTNIFSYIVPFTTLYKLIQMIVLINIVFNNVWTTKVYIVINNYHNMFDNNINYYVQFIESNYIVLLEHSKQVWNDIILYIKNIIVENNIIVDSNTML